MSAAMTSKELQELIVDRLDTSRIDTGRIESKLDRTDAKVDQLGEESRRQHGEVREWLHQHDKKIDLQEHRLSATEEKVGRLDSDFSDLAQNTGKFEVAGLQQRVTDEVEKRRQLEEGKTYWVRWVVVTFVGMVLAVVGWLMGSKFGG
jgi:hypothetical protein